jgi:hypothetical protein
MNKSTPFYASQGLETEEKSVRCWRSYLNISNEIVEFKWSIFVGIFFPFFVELG